MRLETKSQISKATLSLLTLVSLIFVLGIVVLVVCLGLNINPFRETTSSFLGASFGGLIGVAAILVLLNVATNISLIADAKVAELKVETIPGTLRKWTLGFFSVAVILVALIIAGTYASKARFISVVRGQAENVLRNNSSLLDEMGKRLASGTPEDYKRVYELRSFLENQRSGLPTITVIYSGRFANKLAIYRVGEYFPVSAINNEVGYEPVYFPCKKDLDCDYLTRFFSGEHVDVLEKSEMRSDEFFIYFPVVGKESRFVLLFERQNRYGKIGS